MNEKQLELARRLIAHPKWRTIRGMQEEDGLPDLADFATAAILLRLANESDPWRGATYTYSPRLLLPRKGGSLADLRWGVYRGNGVNGWIEREDLGTIAAEALLAGWRDSISEDEHV